MATKKAPPKPPAKAKEKAQKPSCIRPADPNSKTARKLAARTAENLSYAARMRADEFVTQYLRDFNATQAYIRTRKGEGVYEGFLLETARQQGYEMTRWPYVAQKIQEALETAEEKHIVTRSEVLSGLKREALYHGVGASHSARVGGWGKLATILGMDQKQVERALAMKGGIMIVPAVEAVDDWEQRAQAAQAALKEEVRK